ncbi:hypothetical protein JKP88DRAFT_271474 [Tribonema minus]|uniref:Sepiapterin reductase n=1 Tax=Tribonema minus TaxID=303371 RepID=A0A836CM32_9STRA|nr:hypothetical protein JKP88DRAFT_271474 [Tribonema minus]
MSGLPWLVIVTGASRGLGRCLAQEAVRSIGKDHRMTLLLMARSESGLMETAASIRGMNSEDVTIEVQPVDLGNLSTLETSLQNAFSGLDARHYQRCVLFNNAGSLGELAPAMDLSFAGLREAVDLNITSAMWVTCAFVNLILPRWQQQQQQQGGDSGLAERPEGGAGQQQQSGDAQQQPNSADSQQPQQPPPPTEAGGSGSEGAAAASMPDVVVNISSLAAVKPFPTWAAYCAGKAARDMFHAALAAEHRASQLRVLSYAPGPLDTDMQARIRAADGCAPELRAFFATMQRDGALVRPSESAARCVRLVREGCWECGAHVDFFD